MIIVYVLCTLGVVAITISIAGFIKLGLLVYSWFLPSISDIFIGIAFLAGSLLFLVAGITSFIMAGKKHKKLKLWLAHQKAAYSSGAEPDMEEFDMLSAPSTSLSSAANKVVTYCFSQDTFLKPELQDISTTLSSLSGLFKNIVAVMEKRFAGGLTSTKYQQGIEALRLAVLVRIDNQIMQLCAVNENDLQRKATTDHECEQSLNKLIQYVHGTKTLLDKTVGLVSRLALEAMDCDMDVLEKEAGHILELVQELKEYK